MGYRIVIPLIPLFFALTGPAWASDSGCIELIPDGSEPPSEGLMAYTDPVTGKLRSTPPPGEQPATSVVSTAPEPGEIVQLARPDGSVVADIGDRFVTELRMEIVDGKAVTCHRPVVNHQPTSPETASQAAESLGDGR